VEQLPGLVPGVSLEGVFDVSMLCQMSYLTHPGSTLRSYVPIVIRHLATTRRAQAAAADSSISITSALDARQLDSFIDISSRLSDLSLLSPFAL
jgi:hypothetical protein